MRILHVIQSLDPDAGGPPMIAFRLAAAQALLGHEVHLVCHARPGSEQRVEEATRLVPGSASIHRHILAEQKPSDPLTGRVQRELAPHVQEAGAVHLHGVWDWILFAAAAEARRQRRPYFVLLNGMLDPWSLKQRRLKKKVALMLGYRKMLDGAAALHLGNRDEQELIRPLGIAAPAVIIPNGIFMQEIAALPTPGTFRSRFPEVGSDPFVLFLSRLHYKKGLDYLGDAFALLAARRPDVRLVVAGPDGGARAGFEQSVARAGVQNRVHVVGPLYGADKYAALVDATCFCLPSRQEGFSLAITEALGCGLAVVISENCHFPEVAEAGAGFVLPLDPRKFADALQTIVDDPVARQSRSDAARNLIMSRYTWEKIAAQTIDAYRRYGA